jgi:(2Fe-2S) ferredoxin
VLVCQHRTCTKDGAGAVLATLQESEITNVTVEGCGCLGLCGSGPMVVVLPDNVYYWHVTPKKAQVIIKNHLLGNASIPFMMHPRLHPQS